MAVTQMHNLPLTDTRPSTINRLVERQQNITRNMRAVKEENEEIRNCISNEALVLERTLSSIKGL